MADKQENELEKVYVASLLRCLDSDGKSKVITPSSLIGYLFQERENVTQSLDNYVESGIYGLNKDLYNPGLSDILYGVVIVFSGKLLAVGGRPVIQIAISADSNPFILIRTGWLDSWTGWRKISFT